MRRLPAALKREIATFGFVYHEVVPDVFVPNPDDAFLTFEDEFDRVRALAPDTIAYDFTRPVYDHGGAEPRDMSWRENARIRRYILKGGAQVSGGSARAVRLALDDPPKFAERLTDLLAAYWDAAFAEE